MPCADEQLPADRARFVVTPVGLDEVVHLFSEWGLANGGDSLELGRQIVQKVSLATCCTRLAVPPRWMRLSRWPGHIRAGRATRIPRDGGGTDRLDATASVRSQLLVGGMLHGLADGGTLALFVPRDGSGNPEQVADWLRIAWKQTDVVRLRLL